MLTKYYSDHVALERLLATPAEQYLDGFVQELETIGYVSVMIRNYLRATTHLSDWYRRHGLSVHQLDENVIKMLTLL